MWLFLFRCKITLKKYNLQSFKPKDFLKLMAKTNIRKQFKERIGKRRCQLRLFSSSLKYQKELKHQKYLC